ncbi:hypothetical protein RHSIM_Rhsim05G0025700 [Rhododendron simsii]|uniref:Uncharacterized protein n=1 Tax=Rhododendron simsii TaxID=118357 RepID=A0A834LKD7_RHOSS|nr:hypothetical protein RHSIM_Rhsim05G0025700 [Rhododendron simsii]
MPIRTEIWAKKLKKAASSRLTTQNNITGIKWEKKVSRKEMKKVSRKEMADLWEEVVVVGSVDSVVFIGVRRSLNQPFAIKKYASSTTPQIYERSSNSQEDLSVQQATHEDLGRGLEQPLLSVQDLNKSMGDVRNYMLETNCEMSQEISQYIGSAMTEIRDSNMHLAASMGSLMTNVNAMSATMSDLVEMMKEERKQKGLPDLPPRTPVMPHFGVFNGFSRRQPPVGYPSPTPFGFQASSSGGGPAHGGMHHPAQDLTSQNQPRPVENLERRFMLGGNSTPRPHIENQDWGLSTNMVSFNMRGMMRSSPRPKISLGEPSQQSRRPVYEDPSSEEESKRPRHVSKSEQRPSRWSRPTSEIKKVFQPRCSLVCNECGQTVKPTRPQLKSIVVRPHEDRPDQWQETNQRPSIFSHLQSRQASGKKPQRSDRMATTSGPSLGKAMAKEHQLSIMEGVVKEESLAGGSDVIQL